MVVGCEVHGISGREHVKVLISLLERYFSECTNLEQAITFIVHAVYRLAISTKDQVAFDTHTVNSRQDLFDAIDAVDVLIKTRRASWRWISGRQYDRNSSFGTCFNCGKLGHRAFECRNTRGVHSRFNNN